MGTPRVGWVKEASITHGPVGESVHGGPCLGTWFQYKGCLLMWGNELMPK